MEISQNFVAFSEYMNFTVQNSAALEKDPLKIYAIMCNMRRLNSHRELGKFLHTAAATAAAAAKRRRTSRHPFRAKAISYILPPRRL